MNILIVGCGSIGRRHLANILSLDAHVASAVDADAVAARDVAVRHGIAVGTDLVDALRAKPDCVFVTTPTALHLGPALAAARAGCDLFVEKPLSHSMEGVQELLGEVEERRLVTMVGCNMRFHPNIAFMKRFLEEGRLGRVYSVRAEAGSYLPRWRPDTDYRLNYGARRDLGGGVLLDSIHELDYVRWLLGEVVEVQCQAGKVSSLEIETEDLAVILVRFESGALGSVHVDYLQHAYSRHCKLVGERGVLTWNMDEGLVRFYDNDAGSWRVVHRAPEGYDVNRMYLDEIRAFFGAVEARIAPTSDVREGARVLELTLKCKESAGLA